MKIAVDRNAGKVTLTKVVIGEVSGGNRPEPTLPVANGGINNRLQFAPQLGGLVLAHYGDRNVYFIKTSQRS